MAPRRNLAVVPRRPSLTTVAGRGDHRETLESLRGVLARAIDAGPAARDLAALTNRLQSVLAELHAMPVGKEHDPADELIARRAARDEAAAARVAAAAAAQPPGSAV